MARGARHDLPTLPVENGGPCRRRRRAGGRVPGRPPRRCGTRHRTPPRDRRGRAVVPGREFIRPLPARPGRGGLAVEPDSDLRRCCPRRSPPSPAGNPARSRQPTPAASRAAIRHAARGRAVRRRRDARRMRRRAATTQRRRAAREHDAARRGDPRRGRRESVVRSYTESSTGSPPSACAQTSRSS